MPLAQKLSQYCVLWCVKNINYTIVELIRQNEILSIERKLIEHIPDIRNFERIHPRQPCLNHPIFGKLIKLMSD